MNGAVSLCGTVCLSHEAINIQTDELSPAVNFLVQQFSDTDEGGTFMEVMQQAKSEGNSLWALSAFHRGVSVPRTTYVKQTRTLNITLYSTDLAYNTLTLVDGDAEANLTEDYYVQTSASSSSISSLSLS